MGALIRLPRPSPFAFPGGNPGFNPSHVAANGARFSAVSAGNNFINLLTAKKGTLSGAPTAKMDSAIGPSVDFSGSSDDCQINSLPDASTSYTIGAIVLFNSLASGQYIFNSNYPANSGITLGIVTSPNVCIVVPGHNNNAGTQVSAGVPYFIAGSYFYDGANYHFNQVALNLLTGQILSVTSSAAGGGAPGANTGISEIGNRSGSTKQTNGRIAAVMYTTNFSSLPQLLQWAQDPWAFWYP